MKRLSVLDFTSCISVDSDNIPVTVKSGIQRIAYFPSLWKLSEVAQPDLLESRVDSVTIGKDEIILRIRLPKKTF